jgi:hypothetical protein
MISFLDLRSVRGLKHTTVRGYQEAVRSFCGFITDPAYGWSAECESRFGTHPIQVVHEWNTAVHVQDNESAATAALDQVPLRAIHPSAGVPPLARRAGP